MSSGKITEYISAVILTVVLTLLAMLPVLGLSVLCSAASVAVLGYLATKYHYGYLIPAVSIVFLVNLLFMGNIFLALASALPVILCSLSLGISYNLKVQPLKTVGICTGVYTLCAAGSMKLSGAAAEQGILESTLSAASQVYRETLTAASGTQISEQEINHIVSEITSTILQFTPGFIVVICFLFALLCFYLFKRICMLRKTDILALTAFSDWRTEKTVSIIYFALLVLSILLPAGNIFTDAILNVVTVMTVVFFVLGLSLIEHILKKRICNSRTRKLILSLTALFSSILAGIPFLIISVAGAMDGFIDYRQKNIFHH